MRLKLDFVGQDKSSGNRIPIFKMISVLGTFYCFRCSARNLVGFSAGSIQLELANQGLRRRQTARPEIVTILTGNYVDCRGSYILKLFQLLVKMIFYISDIKKLATSEAICSKCQGHIYCSEAPALNMM